MHRLSLLSIKDFAPQGHKEAFINQLLHQAVVVETIRLNLFCLRSPSGNFIEGHLKCFPFYTRSLFWP